MSLYPLRKLIENCTSYTLELDTGVSVSLISAKNFVILKSSCLLEKSSTVLCTYSREQITVVEINDLSVKYNTLVATLTTLVIEGEVSCLLGRNWLKHITLDWKSIHAMKGDDLQSTLERNREEFRDEIGKLKGWKCKGNNRTKGYTNVLQGSHRKLRLRKNSID